MCSEGPAFASAERDRIIKKVATKGLQTLTLEEARFFGYETRELVAFQVFLREGHITESQYWAACMIWNAVRETPPVQLSENQNPGVAHDRD